MSRSDIVRELHKPARRNFARRRVILKGIDDLVQFDLCEFQTLAKENDSYRYILTGINCFSKMGFAVPVKNKTAKEIALATEKILKQSKYRFKFCQTDQGNEFKGAFTDLMKKYNIHHYHSYSELKASICERFNRTLKNKIYFSMSLRGSLRYIDHLTEIVNKYNNTFHRTIKMKPRDVNKRNEKLLLNTVYNYKRPLMKPKFSVGDYVRVSKTRYVFTRGFHPSWSAELFRIHSINRKYPITYRLTDYYGKEIIKGAFYEMELQKTRNKNLHLVEKILKRRGNKVLVRWFGYGEESDSWEKASDILEAEK